MSFSKNDMPQDVLPLRAAFKLSRGGPIIYGGKLVFMAYRILVSADTRLTITIMQKRQPPEQVLHLYSDGCKIQVGTGSAQKGEIWISEWNKPIEISFLNVSNGARFMMGNATSHQIGASTNDWGNYGMLVDEIEPDRQWVLKCSQGMMPNLPDFEALVLHVRAEPNATFQGSP